MRHCVKSIAIRIYSGPYQNEYGDLLCKLLYSVRILENADQKISEYEHFLRNVWLYLMLNLYSLNRRYHGDSELTIFG